MRQLKALFLTRLSVVFLPHNSIYLQVEIVQLKIIGFDLLQHIRVPEEREQSVPASHIRPGAVSERKSPRPITAVLYLEKNPSLTFGASFP